MLFKVTSTALSSEQAKPVNSEIAGRINSVETLGTVDGPGIRFVVFTQGCPLRCQYCHNPDCRNWADGQLVSVDHLVTEINRYASYLHPSGGVTVSGGEPLMQPYFVRELLRRCQQELHLHTTLDTSGYAHLNVVKDVIEFVDLVLLDIKSFDPETFKTVTEVPIQPTLETAQYLSEVNKPVWIRFVLVPGLTDDRENVAGLADFVANLRNVERVEVLPFHKMGEHKWERMGFSYQLKETQPPTSEQVQQVTDIFRSRGLKVV